MSIITEVKKYTPKYWDNKEESIVSRSSHEFDEIEKPFLSQGMRIKNLKRIQNVLSYGSFLVRQQFLTVGSPDVQYYKVRKYVTVPKDKVDMALKFQIDDRRCAGVSSFSSKIRPNGDDTIFIICVTTCNQNVDIFNPVRTTDFYIEYIVDLE